MKHYQQYADYVTRRLQTAPGLEALEALDRFADTRLISDRDRIAIEQAIGFNRFAQPQPTVVNVFNDCNVHIGSIGCT